MWLQNLQEDLKNYPSCLKWLQNLLDPERSEELPFLLRSRTFQEDLENYFFLLRSRTFQEDLENYFFLLRSRTFQEDLKNYLSCLFVKITEAIML